MIPPSSQELPKSAWPDQAILVSLYTRNSIRVRGPKVWKAMMVERDPGQATHGTAPSGSGRNLTGSPAQMAKLGACMAGGSVPRLDSRSLDSVLLIMLMTDSCDYGTDSEE